MSRAGNEHNNVANVSIDSCLEQVLSDQVRDWLGGNRRKAKFYLNREPLLIGQMDAMLDLINQEIVLRRRIGDAPRLEDYDSDFPELADPLSRLFDVHDAISLPTEFHPPPALPAVPGEMPSERENGGLPRIAGYNVERVLGSGGMGVVYLAFDVALKRNVALKTMGQAQYAGREQVERFLAEARAVAHLRHPNIIAIHAIAEHEGRSCLALEFVEGGSLAEKLNNGPMDPRPAAVLVETLARAVQAAHQAGIIHRDLKPSNVLLTADGVPKISDFGLAKLMDSDSKQTRTGQIMGTPSYMAPEQTDERAKQVGPAADVYGIGTILYQTLTGRPPFLGGSALETIRLVNSTEVVPPRQARPNVPKDLETICLKCLQKEPSKRYFTTLALADDLRRFLDGHTILARRASLPERVVRWCRRNSTVAALFAALFAILAAGITVTSFLAVRSMRAEIAARNDRDRAEREAEIAKAINEFLNKDLLDQASADAQATLDTKPDPELKVRTALDRAAKRIEGKFAGKPLVEASIRRTIGETYHKLGLFPQAQEQLEKALALYRRDPRNVTPEILETLYGLGVLYLAQGKPGPAEDRLIEARDGFLQLRGDAHPDTLRAVTGLGDLYQFQGKLADAERSYKQALDGFRQAVSDDDRDTLTALNNLAFLYQTQGRLAEAEPLTLEVVEKVRRLRGPEHPDTLVATNNLGQLYFRRAKPAM